MRPAPLAEPPPDGARKGDGGRWICSSRRKTKQHDAAWRERLTGWMGFGERLTWVLAALFGLGALLVVGNTVRLDIQSRREEIGVLQLLGASDGFIRRPFIYLGAWYGLAAGAIALGLLVACGLALRGPLSA